MQHLEQLHKEELKSIRKKNAMQMHAILSGLLYSLKIRNVYGRVLFVIKCLQSFSVMQKSDFKDHIRYPQILPITFKQYLRCLTKRKENNAAAILPNRIVLFFDAQTTSDAHFVGLFITYHSANCNGFKYVCLDM